MRVHCIDAIVIELAHRKKSRRAVLGMGIAWRGESAAIEFGRHAEPR